LGRERNRERGRGFLYLRGMGEVLGAVGKKREQCLRGMPKEDQGRNGDVINTVRMRVRV
jgi:hypothetical protein